MKQEICLLLSGGVESTHLLFRLKQSGQVIHPLYVTTGHRWEEAEEAAARRLCELSRARPLEVVRTNLASLYPRCWSQTGPVPDAASPDEAVALPGRNAFLLAAASVLCDVRGLQRVVLGTLSSNPFPDASTAFFQAGERFLTSSLGRRVRLEVPLSDRTKPEIIAASHGIPLEFSFSCIDPQGVEHCGVCNKCSERRRAFAAAGLADPTAYALTAS